MLKSCFQRCRSAVWLAATVATVACATLFAPQSAQAQNSKQVALITLSSYNDISADVEFVGKLIGQPQISQQMQGAVMFMAGGLVGLDKDSPIGVAVYAEGEEVSALGMIPVEDADELLGILKNFQIPVEKGADGVFEITVGNDSIFVKVSDGWAIAAQKKSQLANAPAAPAKAIKALSDDYDLGARVYVQNIPAEQRQKAIEAMKEGIEDGLERNDDETDEEYELRKQMTKKQIETFEQMMNEMDEVTFGWNIDSKGETTHLDFAITALADTELAKQLETSANATTNYAGFYKPDAAVMVTFAGKMAEKDIEQTMEMMDTLRAQVMAGIEKEADLPDEESRKVVKSAVDDFFDAFIETMKEGKVDGGAVLEMSPNSLTFVVGGFCANPDKVKSGLKKLEALLEEEPDFPGIEWDAAKHAGVNFHTMSVPVQDDEDAQKLFGDNAEVAIGTGDNSIYFAVGRDALKTCKGIIDESKASPGKKIAPFEMSASLGQIMDMVAALDGDDTAVAIAEMLKNESQGSDHIRITATTIERGVKYRFELESGVLRAIGKAAQMAKENEGF